MQIKPMCKKFKVYSSKPLGNGYSEVTFSVKLESNGYSLIPNLKYKRVLADNLTKYNNGATGYDELNIKLKQPLLTQIVTYIHDKLYYGIIKNRIHKIIYKNFYDKLLFPILNN